MPHIAKRRSFIQAWKNPTITFPEVKTINRQKREKIPRTIHPARWLRLWFCEESRLHYYSLYTAGTAKMLPTFDCMTLQYTVLESTLVPLCTRRNRWVMAQLSKQQWHFLNNQSYGLSQVFLATRTWFLSHHYHLFKLWTCVFLNKWGFLWYL